MGSTNYSQYLPYLFWDPLPRLLFLVYHVELIYELLEVPCFYEPFDFIFECHTPLGVVNIPL